ncbi:hypothetical protein AHAS_Ahas17G0177600 [Arachis hypogaea]
MGITHDSHWQQYTVSIEEMRVTQNNRWEYLTTTVDQMRAAQDSQCQEISQLRLDYSCLRGPYGS